MADNQWLSMVIFIAGVVPLLKRSAVSEDVPATRSDKSLAGGFLASRSLSFCSTRLYRLGRLSCGSFISYSSCPWRGGFELHTTRPRPNSMLFGLYLSLEKRPATEDTEITERIPPILGGLCDLGGGSTIRNPG